MEAIVVAKDDDRLRSLDEEEEEDEDSEGVLYL